VRDVHGPRITQANSLVLDQGPCQALCTMKVTQKIIGIRIDLLQQIVQGTGHQLMLAGYGCFTQYLQHGQ
jgi:hypothetical protein